MVRFIRWLLLPFSALYASIVFLRNWMYDNQLYKSTSFHCPVVVIGNLAVGGTGKSPMAEYILRLVKPDIRVALLSRGYGRKTKGFRYVTIHDSAKLVGDEPLQIKRKFPDLLVAVCGNRVEGIQRIQVEVDAVLLDDAYQHRALRPSFSILLVDYASLLTPLLPLPTGNFREPLRGSKRADVVVITKCPDNISPDLKFKIESRLRQYSQAPVFYTKIEYGSLTDITGNGLFPDGNRLADTEAVIVTGIAKPKPLIDYLHPRLKRTIHLPFGDHHAFSAHDLHKIENTFEKISALNKIIITTEKDMQRLPAWFIKQHPIYFLPIETTFLFDQANIFDHIVKRAFG